MHTVGQVVALARHASMSTSYKPALLKALLRIVRATPSLQISLRDIGAEFLRLYWVQTVVFRLRQAATLVTEPEVVREIRWAADIYRVRALRDLAPDVRTALESKLARILKINVLEAFHKSKPDGMPPLFDWTGTESIELSKSALAFLRENATVLESIANLWWSRYLEKVNLLAPLVIEKVERDGAQRGSLAKYLALLRQTDGCNCFYCGQDLTRGVTVHVEHLIPWSFLLSDPLWDLVLTCQACNLSKSDSLPERGFLDKLATTHMRRAKLALPPGFASPILQRDQVDQFYDAALSVEWPTNWLPSVGR